MKNVVSYLQIVIRAWLTTKKSVTKKFNAIKAQESAFDRAAILIQSHVRGWFGRRVAQRHRSLIIVIQSHCRGWSIRRKLLLQREAAIRIQSAFRCMRCWRMFISNRNAATEIQRFVRGCNTRKWLLGASYLRADLTLSYIHYNLPDCSQNLELKIFLRAVLKLQRWWRGALLLKSTTKSSVVIQSHIRGWIARQGALRKTHHIVKIQSRCRGWLTRRRLSLQRGSVIRIQSAFRCMKCKKVFLTYRHAATEIQRFIRGCITRKWILDCYLSLELRIFLRATLKLQRWWRGVLLLKSRTKSAAIIQCHIRGWIAGRGDIRERHHAVVIQSHCRGWLTRRRFSLQRGAVIRIQSAFRCMKCQKLFLSYRHAATKIQRFVRGHIDRKWLLGASYLPADLPVDYIRNDLPDCSQDLELTMLLQAVLKLQRWWRGVLVVKSRTKAAVVIQSHVRGWIARRAVVRERHRIVVIQSYWKGFLARKESRGQLQELCLRVQKSAANVDDDMRIINRLVSALSELLSMKSVSGILHICATLDMATEHSQKCCETLVAAGAVDTLLKLIRSVSRSIPDQEVLKHALYTLRNLARYPHLSEVLIDSRGSVQTILWELLRNKEEGYFIASELLKRICLDKKGIEAVHNLPALVKRLHNLVEELARKTGNEKRNARGVAKEQTERRLREAIKLLNLITDG
ncbi:unnamed protein product [Ilex paraguariensis]|uniref:Abnormal spindle-like microcephaly-associated protein n=1 Tax=Ilex paraguariensis TaxID=185542 RepID=A0ABC8RV05_9AQUA